MAQVPPARAPSIRDVAAAAGVSYQTVSRVLNDHPSVSPETLVRVRAAIETLQYRPNRAARTLSSSRSRTIGLLVQTRSQFGPFAAAQAIEDAVRAADWSVATVSVGASSPDVIGDGLSSLVEQGMEGLVVIAPQVRVVEAIERLAITVPWVTMQAARAGAEHAVSVDQMRGARRVTRHLIDLGHRRILHLTGPQDWIEAEARMQGFLAEMSDSDLPTTEPILGDWTSDFGYRAGRELFRRLDFTAIFAANDLMALGLVHAAHDAGIDVPGDVSIVGFDDLPEAKHYFPPLTTVRQDFAEIGRLSVEELLRAIEDDRSPLQPHWLEPELIVRASTAPPAR